MQAQGCRAYGGTPKESGRTGCPKIIAPDTPVPLAPMPTHNSAKTTVNNAAEKHYDGNVG